MTADIFPSGVDLGRQPDFQIGELHVRPSAREIEADGRKETLEPRVMQALVVLAARTGEVVSRDALIDSCWEGRSVGDDAVNRCMAKVRRVGMAFGAFALETIPRVGYRLNLVGPEAALLKTSGRPPVWIGLAAGLTVVIALGGWLVWSRIAAPLTPSTPVAVMPFTVATDDPAARAFAATADRKIAGVITDNKEPVVTSSTHGRRFEIGGVVRTEGEVLHALVTLSDSRGHVVLWTRDFTAPKRSPDALSHEIGWRTTYLVQLAHDGLNYRTSDFDSVALGFYLQANDEVVQGSWAMVTPTEALVQRAPRYAPGRAGRALTYLAQASYASDVEAPKFHARAMDDIRWLQENAGDTPWPMIMAASLPLRDWAERERLIVEGFGKFRGEPQANFQLADLMTQSGRLQDGLLIYNQTLPSRRAAPGIGASIARGLHFVGQNEDALAAADRYLAMRPSDASLKWTRLQIVTAMGDFAEGDAILLDPARRPRPMTSGAIAAYQVYIKARRTNAAGDRQAAITAVTAVTRPGGLFPASGISLLSNLGALDEAFDLADAYASSAGVARQGMNFDPSFFFSPSTRAMRADPRFIPLADKLGLLPYWRLTGKWPDFCALEPTSVCAAMKAAPK